jgi:hypothetical protein
MASKRAGRGTVLIGLAVVVAGLAGAVALYLLSQQRDDDAIRNLARAPVGCDTTMSFEDTGKFYVYIEHRGTLEKLEGNCDDFPEDYSRDADDQPLVEITIRGSGLVLDLDRPDDITYSLDDSFAGTAKWQVDVESTGNYVVKVESDENDFVVAVGRDPAHAGDTLRLGAIASGIAGVVLGSSLALVGKRRGRRARRLETAYTAAVPGWAMGTSAAPSTPPIMQPPQTRPFPAPQGAGEWAPVGPVGPPVRTPGHPSPPRAHTPAEATHAGPFAPPRVFAPPAIPTYPASPPSAPPDADRERGGDVRDDASR